MKTIATLKSDLVRKLHGTTLSKVQDVTGLIEEAGRNVLTRIDPQETIRVVTIENALFDDVTSYTCPADVKGDRIIDLEPQVGRSTANIYGKRMIEDFNVQKEKGTFNVLYKNGTKFLRVSEDVKPSKVVVSPVDSVSGWSGTNANNLEIDQLNFVTNNRSLRFDVTAGFAEAIIENSTLPALDLSTQDDSNSVFVWLYIPDASKVTSITGRIGSSAVNYYAQTKTVTHDAQAFADGWNLLRFDLSEASETGTVDWTSITFVQIRIAHDQTGDTNFRLDSITAGVGELYSLYYYSEAIFKTTDGAYSTTISSDTDIIQLETDAYNILLYECAHLLSQELQGENGAFDESYFRVKLDGAGQKPGFYQRYSMKYPSQVKKPRSTYYRMPSKTYGATTYRD